MRLGSLLAAIVFILAGTATTAGSHVSTNDHHRQRNESRVVVASHGVKVRHELIVLEYSLPLRLHEPEREGSSAKALPVWPTYQSKLCSARTQSLLSLQSLTNALQSRWRSRAPPSPVV
jgi:hypothetical protein